MDEIKHAARDLVAGRSWIILDGKKPEEGEEEGKEKKKKKEKKKNKKKEKNKNPLFECRKTHISSFFSSKGALVSSVEGSLNSERASFIGSIARKLCSSRAH